MIACALADGVYPVVPTPFDSSGGLDLESLRRLVAFLADSGANGLLVLGVMGEAPKLLSSERDAVIATSVEAAGSCPVIVGATNPSVVGTRALIKAAAAGGAVAVLIAPPRLDRADGEAGVVEYFVDVADGAELEIVLQDHPASSGVALSAHTVGRIAHEAPSVTAVKHEDPPTPRKVTAVREQTPEGFKIFGGLGGMFLLEELRRGANGTMTGFAYPEVLIEVYRAHARGAADEAAAAFFRYLPLIRFEFQEGVGLAIRKHVYQLRGLIDHDFVRAPGARLDSGTIAELEGLLRWLKLDEVVAGA